MALWGPAVVLLALTSSALGTTFNNSTCLPECIAHDDCPERLACIKNKCFDPCTSRCGRNTECEVIDHIPTCACSKGFTGDALEGCQLQAPISSGLWPPAGKKKFYLETSYKTNWLSAFLHCMKNNSRLARVENAEENNEILDIIRRRGIRTESFAIDGTDAAQEGSWFWMSTGEPMLGYSAWLGGQPDDYNKKEDCLSFWQRDENTAYAWNDYFCESVTYFICEYY